MSLLRGVSRLAHPLYLALTGLTYALGTGIARYLGTPAKPSVFWLALLGSLLAQLAMNLLGEVFRPLPRPSVLDEKPAAGPSVRDAALYVAVAALSACAFLVLALYRDTRLAVQPMLFLGFSLLVILAYALPPVRLKDRGFGELLVAIQIAYLAPSIAFMLQTQSSHRLLDACILPLTVLLFATLIALDFPSYADDLTDSRPTLLTRLGWEIAVPLHHGTLIAAYLLLSSAMLLGFSFRLLWPAFLTVPFAFLQYRFLQNIALGAKPIWGLLTVNAVAVFGLATYFLTLSFWMG